MKKKLLNSMRALLVAAGLCVGANAWGDQTKKIIYNNNYNSVDAASDVFTVGTGTDSNPAIGSDATHGKYIYLTNTRNSSGANRSCYTDLSDQTVNYSNYASYSIEFDFYISPSKWNANSGKTTMVKTTEFVVMSQGSTMPASNDYWSLFSSKNENNSNYLFKLYYSYDTNTSADPVAYTVNGGSNTSFSLSASSPGNSPAVRVWYHAKLDVDVTNRKVYYTITTSADEAVENGSGTYNLPTGTSALCGGLYMTAACKVYSNSYGEIGVDNLQIYTMVEGIVAQNPVVTLTGVSGNDRVYSVSFEEGETLHYTVPGDATEHTETVSPAEVTVTADGDFTAWTTISGSTSDNVVTAVTTGAVTLPTPTYSTTALSEGYTKSYKVNAANDVLLSPTVSLSYVFTPTGGSAQDAVALANGGTINATASGTYVITSSASGYTSSQLTITNTQAYAKTKTYDFEGIDEEDLSSDYWENRTENYSYNGGGITATSYDLKSGSSTTAIPGVSIVSGSKLLIGYGLYPDGGGSGYSLTSLTSDQYVNWTYYAYNTGGSVTLKGYNEKFYGNSNYYRHIVQKAEVYSPTMAITIASSGYSSLACSHALDFSNVAGLTAYVVTMTTNDAVTLTSVNELPANQGVILKGTGGATYDIPMVSSAVAPETNLLSAAVTATDIDANTAYILQGGLFHLVTAASTVPAGKAYLLKSNVPSAARSLGFMFGDDEATGINSVSRDLKSGEFYNLQGQRVDAPKKGLYIVNGTKVFIK